MRIGWRAGVILIALAFSTPIAEASVGAGIGNWPELRRAAADASLPVADTLWMRVSLNHLTLSEYYNRLSLICARAQIEIARRRWFGVKRDSGAVMGAVHGFIANGQNDSAAVWAARDPSMRLYGQFASARAKGQPFSFADVDTRGSESRSSSCLLLALWSGAGREKIDELVKRVGGSSAAVGPSLRFFTALASRDTSAVAGSLERVEKQLADPPGSEGSVLDRFGDPLIYWAMGQGHALLAANAGRRALALTSTSGAASQAHLCIGRGLYAIGELEAAETEIEAATDPLDVGQADAYLAGIAYRQGNAKSALDWAGKCASLADSKEDGPALVALAHVQFDLGVTGWPAAKAAQQILDRLTRSHRLLPARTEAPYWVLALLAVPVSLDSSKVTFVRAANGGPPFPGEGLSESFCADYLYTSVRRGIEQPFPPDFQYGYYGLWKFIDVIPATRALVEGLRWLWIDLYPEEGGKQK